MGTPDPTATAIGFLRAAQRLGARFERRLVTSISERGGRATGVDTPEGTIGARAVVLCSGAWSVGLAAGAGLKLPIRSARVQVALFERPFSLPTHLAFIDSVNEISGRPTADYCTLVGTRLSELEWLDDADRWRPEADEAFVPLAENARLVLESTVCQTASLRASFANPDATTSRLGQVQITAPVGGPTCQPRSSGNK